MDFSTLALITLLGLAGPALAWPSRWNLPVVLGELLAGVVFGPTGFARLDAGNASFTLLANIGFGLIMFVAGTHVPVRDKSIRAALSLGLLRAIAVGALS